ncbi:MAG: DUF4359 domain-containing protein [Flavobacteriales bacterium]|nr:DUF4359 domain-containing protein [Flavobacteriales bacterium]
MKKSSFILGMAALLLILAAATNPSSEKHRDAVKSKVEKKFKDVDKENKPESALGRMGKSLGLMFGKAFMNEITDKLVDCDNYIFFSLTKVKTDNGERVIGMGIFGHVFLSEKVDQAINGELSEDDWESL